MQILAVRADTAWNPTGGRDDDRGGYKKLIDRVELDFELDDCMFKDKPIVEYNPEDEMGKMKWTLSLKAILCYRSYLKTLSQSCSILYTIVSVNPISK